MQPLEEYEISSSSIEKDRFTTTAYFWTSCGKCLEIPLESNNSKTQQDGQKAFSVLADACSINDPVDSSDFHGKSIGVETWDAIIRLLSPPAARMFQTANAPVTSMPANSSEKGRFVYVVAASDGNKPLIKIGIANSPEKRLAQLSTGSPHTLRLELARYSEKARAVERAAHSHFSDFRMNGEWFAIRPAEAMDYIMEATRTAS
ncbi:GIY-YIG nuclease family protein [Rhizobium phaseoli]|uniref:GIY-YIG nuclease family protein n=1 Tax=Rhizobium phaseoli TaxID=396 RepID=UPI00255258E8|nr:GIY-YIG nuclease family protein [Rhizobium phaseoli]MDK4727454.1 GIY-YIG nuclease family protein [Rhizobium phaseoli]